MLPRIAPCYFHELQHYMPDIICCHFAASAILSISPPDDFHSPRQPSICDTLDFFLLLLFIFIFFADYAICLMPMMFLYDIFARCFSSFLLLHFRHFRAPMPFRHYISFRYAAPTSRSPYYMMIRRFRRATIACHAAADYFSSLISSIFLFLPSIIAS